MQNVEKIGTPQNCGKPTASFIRSRGTVVSIVTRLRTGRLRVQFPAGGRDVQTGSGAQSASHSMVMRQGLEAGRLFPSSAEVKSEWSCNSTPPAYFHGAYMDNFNFSASFREVTNQY